MTKVAEKFSIRPASPGEAGLLSDLALRSKAHWGYSEEFLEACRSALTLTPGYISSSPVFVSEGGGQVAGFYGLREGESEVELLYLFVEPTAMGGGHGSRLWKHAVETAARLGCEKISIESDPYAEAFYLRMGARRVGTVPSSVSPDRLLPLLHFP